MKKGIIYWIASCVWMLFSLPLQANDQTVWPEEGLMALWDFTKDRTEDLIGKKKIHYREAYSYEKSVDLRFDTLSNGRIGLSTKCTLPLYCPLYLIPLLWFYAMRLLVEKKNL